jgi:hypothetical protein
VPNYISSNANRFYTVIETAFGTAAAIDATNRMPAVQLQAHQATQISRRQDKTGTRTYLGEPANPRRNTAFEVKTYLSSWEGFGMPGYGPLFQSALGGLPRVCNQLTVESVPGAMQLQTTVPHQLNVGSAVSTGAEIRFVTFVNDPQTISFNAPFSVLPSVGALLAPTVSFGLATSLPSCTLYDYWDPTSAVSRVVAGATVDSLDISLNGDFHEFVFAGLAADLLDSASFQSGEGGVGAFPKEPAIGAFDYSIVAGHLGEAWIGSAPNQFFTLTAADVKLKNNLQPRNQEFGAIYPRSMASGARQVLANFSLFAQDDAQTEALYTAAKLRTAVAMMLQLGQQQGQIMGVYLPSIVPEMPMYDDRETRLIWEFSGNVAKGVNNDELFIAFA